MNAEDNFKSPSHVENKRHTNAHQPSPPAEQQRLQSPLSARQSLYSPKTSFTERSEDIA